MFNLRNKIISCWYQYTDKLLVAKLKRQMERNRILLRDLDNHLYKVNTYFCAPMIVFVTSFLLFSQLLSDKQMGYLKYPIMIYFFYIVLVFLILIIWMVVSSIRKKSFSNLLTLLVFVFIITSHGFLQQFLEGNKYFSFNQNIQDIINFISNCIFFSGMVLAIRLIKKGKKCKF